jgi:hypothetical protein
MPLSKIDYRNLVIYKIVCKDLTVKDVYVGSTTDFVRRKSEHKRHSTSNSFSYIRTANTKLYNTIKSNGGWDNWDMIEIEKCPCSDANEAHSRERYYIEQLNATLNTVTLHTKRQNPIDFYQKLGPVGSTERDEHIKKIETDSEYRNQLLERFKNDFTVAGLRLKIKLEN